jgi:hypothetical protein
MEWTSGNIFIRPNNMTTAGMQIDRHTHGFDHTTFVRLGWLLVRGRLPNGADVVEQFASPEYAQIRELQMKYEPHNVLRPVRCPDLVDAAGWRRFVVSFIGQGDSVPSGAVEIDFNPVAYHALIRADVEHELMALAPSIFDCTYSHRTPQGDVVQINNGWTNAAYV